MRTRIDRGVRIDAPATRGLAQQCQRGRHPRETVSSFASPLHGVSRAIGAQRGDGGALRIVHAGGHAVVGDGEPTATVRTSRFEILRAGLGRRSYEQIAAWDWDGEPLVESLVLSRFSPPRPDPLLE